MIYHDVIRSHAYTHTHIHTSSLVLYYHANGSGSSPPVISCTKSKSSSSNPILSDSNLMAAASLLLRRLPHYSSPFLPPQPPTPKSPPSSHVSVSFRHRPTALPSPVPYSSTSPFTEKDSLGRYQRDGWIYCNHDDTVSLSSSPSASSSCPNSSSRTKEDNQDDREREITVQLPELKKLLEVMQANRKTTTSGHDGGEEHGIGSVALVGTGPGDPELLTLKAVRAIEKADLVLYDRLVSIDILDLVGAGARLLYVGKTAGYHSRTQDEIHELLLSFAEAGANVVRLKGGDPLVFGRGGEEMDFLQQQGIRVNVIPGITSASGIAAELGIPLTHRGIANSVRFLTGHSRNGGTDPLFVSEQAADCDSTLVVYMGLYTLPSLAPRLISHGLPPNTPAVAVERGTTPQQRVVFAELKDLVTEVKSAALVSPTLIIIGKVVELSSFWPQSTKILEPTVEMEQASPGI